MPWQPSEQTQQLLRDPAIARAIADALRIGAREVSLPDGRRIVFLPVEPR